MNLSEALDAALPEIPQARLSRNRPPRLDPELIVREDVLDNEPIVGVFQRDRGNYFRFPPAHWKLANLFDGERSYEEISAAFAEQHGLLMGPEEVRAFAEQMDAQDFWYKSSQEKNLAMREKLLAQRGRRGKSKINLAHISFSAWDPDRYLGWLDRKVGKFVYSPWCTLAVVLLLIFEAGVFIANWSFMGPDIALFYNFTHKNFADVVQFWLLIFVLGFIHETAHGLTCKHFGGQVHSMGLMFLYLVPCFFVDVTESWISATKIQRLATIIAGIWIEMTICGLAMIVWTNTAAGQWLHDFAYQIILLTGVAVVVINLNPLIKLDGYYFLTDIIDIPDLKERSTAFLSAWFQKHVLGISIEVPIVPRRRAPLFFIYAFASGLYSYVLLFFVVRLFYNIAAHWIAELAIIPAGAMAFLMYRSRLRALKRTITQVWERNSGRRFRLRPVHLFSAALIAALLFVPLWRDRESAYFVIEPAETHVLHAATPGRVNAVFAHQGERVHAGQPLLRMSSSNAAPMRLAALAQSGSANFQSVSAQMEGRSIGTAAADQDAAARMLQLADETQSSLELKAPVDGIVLTENPGLLRDQDVASGESLLSIADGGSRFVRIYIPASALDRIPRNAELALALPGQFSVLRTALARPSGDPVALPEGLIARQSYQGIKLAVFYSARTELPESAGNPMFGLSGEAKIFGPRRCLAERIWTVGANVFRSHIW